MIFMHLIVLLLVVAEATTLTTFTTDDPSASIQHVVVDTVNGRVYVGATNSIYQLHADTLKPVKMVSTGPHLDSPYCSASGLDCIERRRALLPLETTDEEARRTRTLSNDTRLSTNNYNKVLLVLKERGVLLACGSIRQGVCQLHHLDDITKAVEQPHVSTAVAANAHNASTVAFVVDGDNESTLFVAATYTSEPYRANFPAVASRSLAVGNSLSLVDPGDVAGQSALVLRAEHRADFKVDYVGGFEHGIHAYWTAVQKETPGDVNAAHASKVMRVCKEDKRYESYAELPLECIGSDNTKYNLIRASTLAKLGRHTLSTVADEYLSNMIDTTEFLVAVFGKGDSLSTMHRNESAVCVYPMKEIEASFWYNIQRCQNGVGTWNLPHFGLTRKCHNVTAFMASRGLQTSPNDCSAGRVGGVIPATKLAVFTTTDARLTTVAVDLVEGEKTVLMLGTVDGRLHKVLMTSSSSTSEYSSVQLSRHRRPLSGEMTIDEERGVLYATAGNELFAVPTSDCQKHTTCAECAMSGDPHCGWCPLSSRCSSRRACRHPSSFIRGGRSSTGDSLCPHLVGDVSPQNASIVASPNTHVAMHIANFPITPSGSTVHCSFGNDGEDTQLLAAIVNDEASSVICPLPSYSSRPAVPMGHDHVTVPLRLYSSATNESFFETAFTFFDCTKEMTMYKCSSMSSDCSRCVTLPSHYDCAWCGGGCRFDAFCPFGTKPISGERDVTCPPPVIESVSPLFGALEGGTRVTIRGRDLGSHRAEVERRVFVAGIPCTIVDYTVSVEVVCITAAALTTYNGPVKISLLGDKTATSDEEFTFVDPKLTRLTPSLGPASGGTVVTISGTHLDVASSPLVSLGTLPCLVETTSSTSITCVTSEAPVAPWVVDTLTVQVGLANRTLRVAFEYTPDPTITSITPLTVIESGGQPLTVRGTHLDSVRLPQLFIVDPVRVRELEEGGERVVDGLLPPLASDPAPCTVHNSTWMQCLSPALLTPSAERHRTARSINDAYAQWPIGLIMDGVTSLHRLADGMQLTLVPDPLVQAFVGGRMFYAGGGSEDDGRQPIVLSGRRLTLATRREDVVVTMDDRPCAITALTSERIVCLPPPLEEGSKVDVRVSIGNVNYALGELVYSSEGGSAVPFTPTVLGFLLVLVTFVLVVVVVMAAIWWRRKSSLAEKEYKRIQLQMDNLETNVRHECKQAFAELHTDRTNDQQDDHMLLPLRDRRAYAARMLFADEAQQGMITEHGRLSADSGYTSHVHVALSQFEALLWNRQFVQVVVDTLEAQSTFCAQERVYMGSLLTTCLTRNMQYCTDVTIMLVQQLIERRASGDNPHTLLRRTDTIVEKMLANWMALVLYDHLASTSAGSALARLYGAMKTQLERGPVDAVTGDARYSLNEDTLLKEHVDADTMTVRVETNKGVVPVTVITCDTITQTKHKLVECIYAQYPRQQRPDVNHIDLELRTPTSSIVMCDDEKQSTSKANTGDAWRRLNTLGTYGVMGNSLIAIIPRQRPSLNYTHGSSNHTYSSSLASSTQMIYGSGHHSPASSSSNGSCTSHSVNYWHLVRPGNMPSPPASRLDSHGTLKRAIKMRKAQHDVYASAATLPRSIPEIYLTRLLTSKSTMQSHVDDLVTAVTAVDVDTFPPAVKYLFDMLDREAARLGLPADVSQSWKNNAFTLRFWTPAIRHATSVLDVERTSTMDSCMATIAQTLVDACSTSETRLCHESPSSKLLFAKDLPKYRRQVAGFHEQVRQLPAIGERHLQDAMLGMSKTYGQELNTMPCVREALGYVAKYESAIMSQLARHDTRLADRLGAVFSALGNVGGQSDRCFTPDTTGENVYAVVT